MIDGMKRVSHLFVVSYLFVSLLVSCCLGDGRSRSEFETSVVKFTILQEKGGRVSWSHTLNLIAFDGAGDDGYFDIYRVNPDGSELKCLTCGDGPYHNGNPAWHPSGYIVFQAQDPDLDLSRYGNQGTYFASPGIGVNNNLWVMDADGSKFWQLTHVKDYYGTLHPQFSCDGKKLLWSEIINPHSGKMGGQWAIKIADFSIEEGVPTISHLETLRPGDLELYETHGFSPDGKKILFSGVEKGKYYYDMEIYIMDVETGECEKLTDNDEWDEHAHFTTDGSCIVWASSEDTPQPKGNSWEDILANPPVLEYWIMNLDGSGKRRLSGFNSPDAPEYMSTPGGVGLGDFDWGPDGKAMVAKIRKGRGGELTALIEFDLESVSVLYS